MGESTCCLCHDLSAEVHICGTVVFIDLDGTICCQIMSSLDSERRVQLNFWTIAIMFGLSLVALNYFIRFRYLNKYTKLNEPPLVKSDAQELHPDVNTPEAAPAFHNYLDEFLQAVRVFGFLEKPEGSPTYFFSVMLTAVGLPRACQASAD